MRNFFTSFFGTLTALVIFLVGGGILCFLLLGAIIALNHKPPVAIQDGTYLVFDISATILDTPSQNEGLEEILGAFGDDSRHELQLRQVTRALEAAASDKFIKGLYLSGSVSPMSNGSGYAALKEVRDALEVFKSSGKPVKAYLRVASTRDFYLASTATDLALDPYGALLMPGLASQPMFYTGAFEKFGIGVQVTRVGKYKSGVEPYTRKDMSQESREQLQVLIDGLWGELTSSIEVSRGLRAGAMQKIVDAKGLIRAEVALETKLVDRVVYFDEILAELKEATGRKGSDRPFKQINLKNYSRLVGGNGGIAHRTAGDKIELPSDRKGRLAIVYAEGEIVDGTGNEEGYVYGAKTARLLRQIRQDDTIKAVVLRVNSPGGSVTASEEIVRELSLLQKERPVVVSMGSMAASGGYWISTSSDRIFAEPTTITGSIGVYGLIMNFQGLLNEKLGLTFDTVKTGKFADVTTITRPKTPEEMEIFQESVDWVYGQFISRVVAGRRLDRALVEEIAQGRVWSGSEALKLGLVDELGGLKDALNYAGTKANLGENFQVTEYPRQRQFLESFGKALERHQEKSFGGSLGLLINEVTNEMKTLDRFNDPNGLYARLPFDLRLR